MGGFKGKGLVLSSSGLTRVSEFSALARSEFNASFAVKRSICSFLQQKHNTSGCGMGGCKGKGLVLRAMHIRPTNVSEFSA